MEEIDEYVDRISESAQLNEEQKERFKRATFDLVTLSSQLALDPENQGLRNDIEMCKITIESLGVVSFNGIKKETEKIAKELFIKGLSIALSSL